MRPVQEPYQVIGQIGSLVYFSYYPLHCVLERSWDILMGYLQFSLRSKENLNLISEKYDGRAELGWSDLGRVN